MSLTAPRMLTVYRSNRVEALADELEKLLRAPLADALAGETIVVQSLGMRRWLSFEIARRLGVAMNCEFPFFAEFGQRVFRDCLGGEPAGKGFSRDVLPWRVLGALETEWARKEFDPVRRYVGQDEASELKRFQIARQIATVFDRYMAHDPERLLRWERGEDAGWQSVLWRALGRAEAGAHPPALLQNLEQALDAGSAKTEALPERISVFGVASLPSFYLQLLRVVANAVPVHFFLFEPTDQYWGDIRSPRDQRRILKKHARAGQTAADLHLETGNELLASWGKAGRAFADEVQNLEPDHFVEPFHEPEPATLLGRLQRDIFQLRSAEGSNEEDEDDEEEEDVTSLLADRSVQIHCCHSPMRELEVLYDTLLALFERLPGLTPKDVLVTMPDVQKYAPFIEAVFGTAEREQMWIPYTIADRSAVAGSAVARTFLKILDLPGKRLTASEVLEILEAAPVRERFGISESELRHVRAGIARNGIRWGIDGPHRAGFGVPAFAQNSWRQGLDRWLLGTALMSDGPQLYGELLPDCEAEGGLALLAGNFADFAGSLFALLPALGGERTLREWSDELRRALDRFFEEDTAEGEQVLAVRRALATLGEMSRWHEGRVHFAGVRAHLQAALGESDTAGGFLAGQVTFCSLKPMRSIPFRVICTLGMNDGAFPRKEIPIAFDLLSPANGGAGRSRREEDRQLFLESLLSAREVFYISYSGRSTKDNSEAPPATVVSELLDYLEALAPSVDDDDEPYARLITRHPLQPFSRRYFEKGSPLFSYSAENCFAAQPAERVPGGRWAAAPLSVLEPEWRRVELRRLVEFFRHPARYFLRHRLGVELPGAEEEPDDCEPLALAGLERWQLGAELTSAAVNGRCVEEAIALARAAGRLPAGHFGEVELAGLEAKTAAVVAQLAAVDLGEPIDAEPIALTLGAWALTGTLENRREHGLVEICGGDISPKDRIGSWIRHLALNAALGGSGATTVLVDSEEAVRFEPLPNAAALLTDLLEVYALGLAQPLHFFPHSAYEFASRAIQAKGGDLLAKARSEYDSRYANDPHIAFCYAHLADPLDDEFQQLALRIFEPMLRQGGGGEE